MISRWFPRPTPADDVVHRQHRRLLERRGEERRGGVALMMLGEQQPVLDVEVRPELLQFVAQQQLLKQLFLEPKRHRHAKRAEPARREGEIRLKQALEFQERLVVEGDVVELVDPHAARFEAIARGAMGKMRVVLLAAETLLLRGGQQPAVLDQTGGTVMVEGGDAEDAQRSSTRQKMV